MWFFNKKKASDETAVTVVKKYPRDEKLAALEARYNETIAIADPVDRFFALKEFQKELKPAYDAAQKVEDDTARTDMKYTLSVTTGGVCTGIAFVALVGPTTVIAAPIVLLGCAPIVLLGGAAVYCMVDRPIIGKLIHNERIRETVPLNSLKQLDARIDAEIKRNTKQDLNHFLASPRIKELIEVSPGMRLAFERVAMEKMIADQQQTNLPAPAEKKPDTRGLEF
jgi:hypothetical protein